MAGLGDVLKCTQQPREEERVELLSWLKGQRNGLGLLGEDSRFHCSREEVA